MGSAISAQSHHVTKFLVSCMLGLHYYVEMVHGQCVQKKALHVELFSVQREAIHCFTPHGGLFNLMKNKSAGCSDPTKSQKQV